MRKPKERRAYTRLDAYHLVKYRIISTAAIEQREQQAILSSAKDISAGGLRLRTKEDLPVSTVLQLSINCPLIPQSKPYLAKVVWARPLGKTKLYEIGVHFIDIDKNLQEEFQQNIAFVIKKLSGKRGEGE